MIGHKCGKNYNSRWLVVVVLRVHEVGTSPSQGNILLKKSKDIFVKVNRGFLPISVDFNTKCSKSKFRECYFLQKFDHSFEFMRKFPIPYTHLSHDLF